jgi:hypothetical protein
MVAPSKEHGDSVEGERVGCLAAIEEDKGPPWACSRNREKLPLKVCGRYAQILPPSMVEISSIDE